MKPFRIIVVLLIVAGCKSKSSTGAEPSATASAIASASSQPPAIASSAPPPAVASSAPLATASSMPDAPTKPAVEIVEAKTCPAPIARVKVAEGTVEAIGCPDAATEGVTRLAAKSRLVLLDASGKQKAEVVLTDAESASVHLAVEDLYGDGRPVFFTTVTEPTLATWSGPTTSLWEINGGALRRVRASKKGSASDDIELVSTAQRNWWLHQARDGKKGYDIHEVRTSAEGKTVGYRYTLENARWIVRSAPLKNWPDGDEPFP